MRKVGVNHARCIACLQAIEVAVIFLDEATERCEREVEPYTQHPDKEWQSANSMATRHGSQKREAECTNLSRIPALLRVDACPHRHVDCVSKRRASATRHGFEALSRHCNGLRGGQENLRPIALIEGRLMQGGELNGTSVSGFA